MEYDPRNKNPYDSKEGEVSRPLVTLPEMVVIAVVIFILWGLTIPAVQSGPSSPRTHCANNLKQIGVAFTSYESSHKRFPFSFYFEETRPDEQRNWVIAILRELDEGLIADEIDEEGLRNYADASISTLICRDDNFDPHSSHLSYTANMGLRDSFYLSDRPYRSRNLDGSAFDSRQAIGAGGLLSEMKWQDANRNVVTAVDIRDGAANTLLCAENIDATFWNPFAPELQRRQLLRSANRLFEFDIGLVWFDWKSTHYNVESYSIDEMKEGSNYFSLTPDSNGVFPFRPIDFNYYNSSERAFTSAYFYARPSSNHSGGFNIVRFDGSTDFISARELDYDFYCRLMSGNSAKLFKRKGDTRWKRSRGYGKLPEY